MSKQEVINYEILDLEKEESPIIYLGFFCDYLKDEAVEILGHFKLNVGNYEAFFAKYYFVLGEFIEFSYTFPGLENYQKSGKSIANYMKQVNYFDSLLTIKYGKSTDFEKYDKSCWNYNKSWENRTQ